MNLPVEDVAQPTGKQLAILYYLSASTRPVPKEELAELLWDGKRANLRVALHRLRAVPGARDWLLDERDLGLRSRSDLEEFEKHVEAGEHASALEVWKRAAVTGPARTALLEGFVLRNAPVFQDWLEIERRRVERLYLKCLQSHAAELGEAGRYVDALACWLELLREDPLHEEAYREVMRLEWLRGDAEAAMVQFTHCRRVLSEELGLEPLPETVELYERIRASRQLEAKSSRTIPSDTARRHPRNSPFIGRDQELARLGELLGERRIVSISGPGGVGKTRLAERLAELQAPAFADGTAVAYLADLDGPDFLVPALGQAMDLEFDASAPPKVQLLDFVRDKQLLLVVDNMEHLLSGAALVQEMLDHAPELVLLITTREPLELPEEAVFALAGLPHPAIDEEDGAERFDAVRLFVAQARRADPSFRLSGANRGLVSRVCRLVDGLPLAIELAAGWVRNMPLGELADDLAAGLDRLRIAEEAGTTTSGSAENIERQAPRNRSMEAALEHSWMLLGDDEREAMMAVAVFRGGFDRDAAAAAGAVDLRMLLALVNKSLLVRTATGRFTMLEVVRQFAAEKLARSPAKVAVRERTYVEYFSRLAAECGAQIRGPQQAAALARLTADAANFRQAWQLASRSGSAEHLESMLEAVYLFERTAGLPQNGAKLLAEAAAKLERAGENDSTRLRRKIEARLGALQTYMGQYQAAEESLEGSLASALETGTAGEVAFCRAALAENAMRCGDPASAEEWGETALRGPAIRPPDEAKALLAVGAALGQRGELAEARRRFEKALEKQEQMGDAIGAVKAHNSLGVAAGTAGDFEVARSHFRNSLEGAQEFGDRHSAANALGNLGMAALILEDRDEARRCFEESLRLRRALGSRPGLVDCLTDLGILDLESERLTEAREHFEEAAELAQQLGNPQKLALIRNNFGLTLAKLGEFDKARTQLAEALALYRRAKLVQGVLSALGAFGQLFVFSGDPRMAALVLSFVAAEERTTAEARMVAQQTLPDIERDLGTERLSEARREASGFSLDGLTEFLLEHPNVAGV